MILKFFQQMGGIFSNIQRNISTNNQLKKELKNKFGINKSVYIDNGSSPIIDKIIQKYNFFHIQKHDFYLFEEILKTNHKNYCIHDFYKQEENYDDAICYEQFEYYLNQILFC